ncbi:Poly(A) RNA polymerase cid13 [Grifola frondosa]|uniref:Poly(A) RNA polymerase cid13 n=1 Tax=Grifola frondosa TaxID=5627 RepID=A0A1C7MMU5_GRIFR|nr:Poly(A) RNA polymerase cid13 [Grifola frondosa]
MRQVRCFSTSLRRHSKQQLYVYTKVLTSEEKKVINKQKFALRPIYHRSLEVDFNRYLQRFATSRSTRDVRNSLLQQLKQIVQSRFGNDFDVEDISMWRYATDVEYAPLEFAVVDKKHPHGIPNEPDVRKMGDAYDPRYAPTVFVSQSRMAEALMEAGFAGHYESRTVDRAVPSLWISDNELGKTRPPQRKQTTVPWPEYEFTSSRQLYYPPRLEAVSPQKFSLVMPGPTVMPLIGLLQAYGTSQIAVPRVTSMVLCWMQSLGLNTFSPLWISMMLIHWLQRESKLQVLAGSKDEPELVWVPSSDRSAKVARHVDISAAKSHLGASLVRFPREPSKVFVNFLNFWAREINPKILRQEAVSISAKEPLQLGRRGHSRWYYQRKQRPGIYPQWELHPMVLQDPFIPTYNHAEFINNTSLMWLMRCCHRSASWLLDGHPLTGAFGTFGPFMDHDEFIKMQPPEEVAFEWREGYQQEFPEVEEEEESLPEPDEPEDDGCFGLIPTDGQRSWHKTLIDDEEPAHRNEGRQDTYVGVGLGPKRKAKADNSHSWPPREHDLPPHTMSRGFHTFRVLRIEKHDIFKLSQAPPEVLDRRTQTLKRIQQAIHKAYGTKYDVQLFGSTCYGMDSAGSDLDIVILDSERPQGFAPGVKKLPPIYHVKALGSKLSRFGFKKVQCTQRRQYLLLLSCPAAVKFSDPHTGMTCDLNVNDRLGSLNTALIRRYCELAPALPEVMVAVKHWAKPLGLNNPSGGGKGPVTFSSYALTLMTIGLFQIRGWLPNLQKVTDESVAVVDKVFWIRGKKNERVKCAVRYGHAEEWKPEMRVTMEEALIKDTENPPEEDKFMEEETESDEESFEEPIEIIQPRQDQPSTWLFQDLCVSDPFILSKNCAQNLSHASIRRFREECQRVSTMLNWGCSMQEVLPPPSETDKPSHRRKKEKKQGNSSLQAPRPPKEVGLKSS